MSPIILKRLGLLPKPKKEKLKKKGGKK